MTGFARADGFADGASWTWEIKSINSRSLDARFRLPHGFDRLESRLRGVLAEHFTRGNFSLNLTLVRPARSARLQVNRELLDEVLALAEELKQRIDAAPPRADGLLAVRGVLEQIEEEDTVEERERLEDALAATLFDGLDDLAAARSQEGASLAAVITDHLGEIAVLAEAASQTAEAQPKALLNRLRQQLDALIEDNEKISDERLAQEVALLAAKSDVREEIDRLKAHVAASRELLAAGGAIGRRLDFLCQEFNREANTLCAKAADIALTRIGLDLKATIERLREQAQNIE